MKKRLTLTVTGLLFFYIPVLALSGKQILQEQEKRHKTTTEFSREVMLLVDSSGAKEIRAYRRYSKKFKNGLNRGLFVFLSPNSARGIALLSWEQKSRDNDQWIYMPATKRLQRLSSGSKKGYFMGTDFTYEDMEPEKIENFIYTVIANTVVRGKKCWAISAVPANSAVKRNSGYSKRILWIRKDIYVTVEIEFYDRYGKLIKAQHNLEFVPIGGQAYRANKSLMRHFKRKHRTVMGVKLREVNSSIDSSVFEQRYITTGRHLQ